MSGSLFLPVPPVCSSTFPRGLPVALSVDFVTGLPPSGGNTVTLTILDRFSKRVHFVHLPPIHQRDCWAPVATRIQTATLSLTVGHNLQPGSGLSRTNPSSGFHYQTNSQTERFNQKLESGLHLLCSQEPASRTVFVKYAHNSLPSSATGLTPIKISFWLPSDFRLGRSLSWLAFHLWAFPEPFSCAWNLIWSLDSDYQLCECDSDSLGLALVLWLWLWTLALIFGSETGSDYSDSGPDSFCEILSGCGPLNSLLWLCLWIFGFDVDFWRGLSYWI